MTKTELMETYTAEQLAEMVEKLQEQTEVLQEIATEKERKTKNNIITVVIGGIVKEYQIEEIGDIVRAYEEIKICQEQNKQCETILPSEYLKVLTLNQTVSELQSEVEKYHKAFEDAKKERDYQIAEYQKKIEELERELKYKDRTKMFETLMENTSGEAKEHLGRRMYKNLRCVLLYEKTADEVNISDYLPTEPIKVADMLINAEEEYEHNPLAKKICGNDKGVYRIFDISELRQIAEHLLIYCNHNTEVEE